MTFTASLDVPVRAGALHVARAGGDGPVVLAVHGITASSRSWPPVIRALLAERPDCAVYAPDLRGRGRSRELPGPYGIAGHVQDLLAVLDAAGADRAVLAGHSMGAWTVARLAAEHPDRVHAVVLVDGGVSAPLPPAAAADPDAALDRILGPSITRLAMTFPTEDAYVGFWRDHPAFANGRFNEDVAAYARYDLVGEPPRLRASALEDAVRADGRDLLLDEPTRTAVERIAAPVHLLRAGFGLLHDEPFLAAETIAGYARRHPSARLTELSAANHHTIALGEGAASVAAAIRDALP